MKERKGGPVKLVHVGEGNSHSPDAGVEMTYFRGGERKFRKKKRKQCELGIGKKKWGQFRQTGKNTRTFFKKRQAGQGEERLDCAM